MRKLRKMNDGLRRSLLPWPLVRSFNFLVISTLTHLFYVLFCPRPLVKTSIFLVISTHHFYVVLLSVVMAAYHYLHYEADHPTLVVANTTLHLMLLQYQTALLPTSLMNLKENASTHFYKCKPGIE